MGAYSNNPEHNQLMEELSQLACEWRSTKENSTANLYSATLLRLMSLGWKDELPIDIELPDEFLPPQYLNQQIFNL